MSINPLDSAKKIISLSTNSISDSYSKISPELVNLITPVVQTLKPNIIISNSLDTQNNLSNQTTTNTTNTISVLENFISTDNDLKKISLGLSDDNFNCHKPLNIYVVFFWLVIILLMIYLLFEYLFKKYNEKLL